MQLPYEHQILGSINYPLVQVDHYCSTLYIYVCSVHELRYIGTTGLSRIMLSELSRRCHNTMLLCNNRGYMYVVRHTFFLSRIPVYIRFDKLQNLEYVLWINVLRRPSSGQTEDLNLTFLLILKMSIMRS